MLIDRLLPDRHDWDVKILATDINEQSLQRADAGCYGQWSFRSPPPWLEKKYFKQNNDGRRQISPRIRNMVEFESLNLVAASKTAEQVRTGDMDLILCRNVLMYFRPEDAERVVDRFCDDLAEGGWLIVSAVENAQILSSRFELVSFPEAIFYRKSTEKQGQSLRLPSDGLTAPARGSSMASLFPAAEPLFSPFAATVQCEEKRETPPSMPEASEIEQARELYRLCRYQEATVLLQQQITDPQAKLLLARIHANQRELDAAAGWCRQALADTPMDPAGHFVYGSIQLEQDDIEGAFISFRRVLYLDPDFILAHWTLSHLCRLQGRLKEATRHRKNAQRLTNSLPPAELLPEGEGMTAGRLQEVLNAAAATQGGAL
jgi:chemotaxis protein methyltransferase CheR